MPAATASRYDVVIVGAGATGLTAAGILSRAGMSVAVLEARSILGGRIRTRRVPGWPVPLELGAEFIHGRSREVFDAASAAHLRIHRIPAAHAELRGSRLWPMPDPWGRFHRITSRLPRSGGDLSVADYLAGRGRAMSAPDRRFLATMVESYDAAPLASASVQALSTAGEPPIDDDDRGQFRLDEGYGALIDALVSEIDDSRVKIFLSTVVKRVVWSRGRARLITGRGEFRASRVLVTVPVGVLRAAAGRPGAIAFDPEPPTLCRALAGLAMGDVVKLVLRFERPFWRDSRRLRPLREDSRDLDPAFLHLPAADFPTWWTTAPVEAPVLTAWSGGPRASKLLRLPPRTIVQRALETLARGLGLSAARTSRLLVDWDFRDWSADPYSRGAYSYALVGSAGAARLLARPVAGTLYFAGEAASREESGTVGAAIASGRDAARRLLR